MYTNCDKEIHQFTQSGVEKIKEMKKIQWFGGYNEYGV